MYNVIKRTFTFSVVVTTILWSVGVAALIPSVAEGAVCPTLAAGDMIKVTGKPAIYAIRSDLKVLYFPSGDEFKSWRPTYGGYISVTQECFDSLPVPSNYPAAVNYHPGSYLIKRPSSDQLYVVEPGNKKAKISQSVATSLYGTNAYTGGVGSKVMTVSDVFWPHYTNDGADVATATVHPGMLFKVSGQATTWYVDSDSKLREVTATGFTANQFQQKFVRTVPASAISGLSTGAILDAEVPSVVDKTQSGGVTTVPSSNPVSVSLAADNPASMTIPMKATGVEILKFVVKAGSSATTLSELILHRTGVGSYDDFAAIYVYDGNTRLTSGRTIASDTNNATVPMSLALAAGESKTLRVLVDLKTAGGNNGNEDGIEVVKANGYTITGVSGNLMTIGGSNVSPVTVDNSGTAGTFALGATGVEMAKGTINAGSATYDVKVNRLTLTNAGSLSNDYIKNLKLTVGSTDVATAASMTGDKVNFTLNTPYTITKGDTKTFYVYGDCTGGRVADNIKFYVDETSDVGITDSQYNVGVYLTNSFASGDQTYTVTGGDISLANNGPAAGNIGRDITNVTLHKFSFSSTNAVTVKSTKLWVYVKDEYGNATNTAAYYNYVKNVKIVDLDNNNSTILGPIAAIGTSGTASGNSYYKTMTDNYSIGAGTTRHLAVLADIDSSAPNSMVVYTKVDYSVASTVKYDDNSQYVTSTNIVPNTLTGNQMTVNAASITVVKSTPPTTQTVVKGSTQEALGMILTAGTAASVKVTSLKVRVFASSTSLTTDNGDTAANTAVNTVSLWQDGGTSALATKNLSDLSGTIGSSGYYYVTYTGLNYVIPAGETKKLIVKFGLKDSLSSTTYVMAEIDPDDDMDVETSLDGKTVTENSTSAINASSPVQLAVGTAGALTVSVDGNTSLADIVVSGSAAPVSMTTYKFYPQYENFTITGLRLKASTGYYTDIKKVVVTYKNKLGDTVNKECYLNTSDECTFSDGQVDAYLPLNQNTLITVNAYFNTITEGATSGHAVKLGLIKDANQFSTVDKLTDAFIALGEASNTKLYGKTNSGSGAGYISTIADSTVTAKTVRKTKVTVAESDSGSASHSTRSQDPVGVFTFVSEAEPGSTQNSTLSSVTVQLTGSLIANSAGSNTVTVYVYNGSTFDSSHLMGSGTLTGLDSSSSTELTINLTSYNEWSGTKTVYVVVDTTDSDFSDTTTNVEKLTTKLTTFYWYDGSAYAVTPVTGVPIYSDTYSY